MAISNDALTLEVATPAGLALQTEATAVQAPSVRGEFGVLPGHLPLLAALRCGVLKYRSEGHEHVAAVGPGFVEAGPDRVLLLTDLFALPDQIDEKAVRVELAEAEAALKSFPERYEGPEYVELQLDIDWAQARLDAHATRTK